MTLYLRLLLLLLRKIFRPVRLHPLDKSVVRFRCLPLDCDYNFHLTNARYFSFCDLARIGALMDRGPLGKLVSRGLTPIIIASNASYFKEIRLFQVFEIQSRILGWDERFWYFKHDFLQDGQLKGTVLAKGLFVEKRKVIPFLEIMRISGHDLPSPELPAYVREWSSVVEEQYRSMKGL